MNLIFVSSYFYPDHSAGSQILSDLAFYLVENNFTVSIVTSRAIYGNNGSFLPMYENIKDVEVHRVWSSSFGRRFFFGRVINYISLEMSQLFKLSVLTSKNDIVIFMTDPPLLNVISSPVVNFKGGKVVNWLQDLFPEVAVGAGVFSEKSIINKLLARWRNKCLNNSIMNVVIGNKMYDYLKTIHDKTNNIVRIPNWSNGSSIKPVSNSDNYLRKQWGLEDKFVVGYSGNLGHAHNIETILKAAEVLKDSNDIVFLFIGAGVGMKNIKDQFKERGILNVCFQPYQPRNLLNLSLSVSDIHWVTLEPVMEGFIVPSKFYGILAVGRPVIFIGDKSGEIASEIDNIKCGVSVGILEYKILAEIIQKLSNDLDEVIEMGARGREKFELEYDFPISALKFKQLFEGLSKEIEDSICSST